MTALLSLLGGSAFRMVWGEISHWITAAREHKREIELMKVQGELDAAQHSRNIESIKLQAELGVKTIQVQAEADVGRLDAEGFYTVAREALKPSGIWLVDLWNGCIRPAAVSVALFLWVVALNRAGWTMTEWDRELVAGMIGFFFASRELGKRGK